MRQWEEISRRFSEQDVAKWTAREVDGKNCLISPVMERPVGDEINHYRVNVTFEGGQVDVSVLHAGSPILAEALKLPYLHSPFVPATSGQDVAVTSPYSGERCSWIILRPSSDARIHQVNYSCWRAKGTLYGHEARTFDFDGGKLRYRLMYPRDYDPKKAYPLVLSVHGSGGSGSDNAKNMEMVILGTYLFTHYYNDPELACFSIVPQIPGSPDAIPPGYFPKGDKGKPTPPYHSDWAAVNENGWYVQATLALIQSLLKDPSMHIDPDRVYYSGFSLGGKGCWEFLKAGRDVFAGALCGAGWAIGSPAQPVEGVLAERLKLEVQRYKHIPVMIVAGEKDPMMRPGSIAVNKELQAQGGKSTYIEVPGADHVGSNAGAWGQIKNLQWLFQQNRAKNPAPGPDPFPKGEYGNP